MTRAAVWLVFSASAIALCTIAFGGSSRGADAEDGVLSSEPTSVPTREGTSSRSRYSAFFADVVDSLDPISWHLYDEELFKRVAAAESAVRMQAEAARASEFLPVDPLVWSLAKRFHLAPMPSVFTGSRAKQLQTVRTFVSLAVGRIRFDGRLHSEYDALARSNGTIKAAAEVGRAAFEKATGSVVFGIFQYAHTILQTLCDVSRKEDDAPSAVLRELQQLSKPLRRKGGGIEWLRKRFALLKLDSHTKAYEAQTPKNGRFWNALRPVVGCSTVLRLCEQPDGCRYVCNPDYIFFSGAPSHRETGAAAPLLRSMADPSSVRWRPRAVDMVGFGSNDEYDWEESIIRSFDPTRSPAGGRPNILRAIVSFDCTIKTPHPTPTVLSIRPPGSFGFVQRCLDQTPSQMSITLRELQPVLRTGKRLVKAADLPPSIVSARNHDVQEPDDAVSWFGGSAADFVRSHGQRRTMFKRISILKVDVEGFEFGAIAQWLRDEMAAIGKMWGDADGATFDEVPGFASVEQIQFELHRMGHKGNAGFALSGAMQAHLLMLNLFALGFVPAAQERNHADNCCYEFAAPSSRFYILSEAWGAMGPLRQ